MQKLLLTTASALALVWTTPAIAHECVDAGQQAAEKFRSGSLYSDLDESSSRNADAEADNVASDDDTLIEEGETVPEGIRQAQGDEAWEPDELSDDGSSLITEGETVPEGMEERQVGGLEDDASPTASDDSSLIEEGETVPEDIRQAQGDEAWEPDESSGDEQYSETEEQIIQSFEDWGAELNDQESARTRPQDTGRDVRRQGSMQSERQTAYDALRSLKQRLPEVRFTRWSEADDADDATYEFNGYSEQREAPVNVLVDDEGTIVEIEEQVALSAMPRPLRRIVASAVGNMRVYETVRSVRSDLDVYYELDGRLRSGRRLVVEVREDGNRFSARTP